MTPKIKLVIVEHRNMPPSVYASLPDTEFEITRIDIRKLEAENKSNHEIDALLYDALNLLYPVY